MSNAPPVAWRYKNKDDERWLLAYDHPGNCWDQVEGLDQRGWRCWHCGEFFPVAEREKARGHFGCFQDNPQCIVPKETWQAMTNKIERAQKERDEANVCSWQNLDRILDVLRAAGCCKDSYVHAPEDVVANAIRDWLRLSASARAEVQEPRTAAGSLD